MVWRRLTCHAVQTAAVILLHIVSQQERNKVQSIKQQQV
jgi:hypothetical protein